jgi:hypothetical protein
MEHHFLDQDTCPDCHLPATSWYEIWPGDCIDCGAFCNATAYACDQPRPLDQGIPKNTGDTH